MKNLSSSGKRSFGCWDAVSLNIAIVVGVGIFRVPAEVAHYCPSSQLILLAWVTGGIISLLGALCYAELSTSFPRTGGNYIYLKESYGPLAGFVFGWTELIAIRTGSIAAVAFIFAEYLQSFLSLGPSAVKPAAVLIVLALSLLNMLGLHQSKKVQNFLNVVKITALLCLICAGLFSGKGNIANFYPIPGAAGAGSLSMFGLALIPILWTYGGWHENTFVSEETKNGARTLPQALIRGVLIVTALYLGLNLLYLYLLPVTTIASSKLIASDVLQLLCAGPGTKILEALIMISSLGCLNAMITTGSRVTYAMAKDFPLFRYLGTLNASTGAPHRAIILNAGWTIVLILWGTFNQLLFFTGTLVWFFFILVTGALFILRRKFPLTERPYKVWGYPAVPALFILICAGLLANNVYFYPSQSLIGVGLAAMGVPLFLFSQRQKKGTAKITSG